MDENRTVKVEGGSPSGYDPTVYGGQHSDGVPGSWDETQYMRSDQPTPRPGEVPAWSPHPAAPSPWESGQPTPGGAQTIIMGGPKPVPSFAWLVMVSAPGNNPYIGQALPIKGSGTTVVGRVAGNDIVIPDPACSGQHAKIRSETDQDSKQVFVLYDLASSNGLYVGSAENYKEEANRTYRHVLQDGDYILIGETTLVFKKV